DWFTPPIRHPPTVREKPVQCPQPHSCMAVFSRPLHLGAGREKRPRSGASRMGANDPSQDDLAGRLQDGDDRAARELFARYAHRLAVLAERHLSDNLAARVDGEDVVQSVFRTFFRRCARGEFQIDSSAQLWRLLVKITVRKARAKARQHTAAV